MYIIGLTGGIASGKSTVSAMLKDLGAYIIDADKIARDVVTPGKPAWQEIVDSFGQDILLPDGNLNRKMLGSIVFANPESRKKIDEITHPCVLRCVTAEAEQAKQQGYEIAVLDVPLLFEAGWQDMADEVWVIYVDERTQLSRLMQRDGLTDEQAMMRIKAQMSMEEKRRFADIVIDNSRNIEDTREQVLITWNRVKTIAQNK